MKKTAYYLSPFVIVPIIFLIATLLENAEILKPIVPYFMSTSFLLFAVVIGMLSPLKVKFDCVMATLVPFSVFFALFIALLFDDGCDGMPQFSLHHALNIEYYRSWLPIVLAMMAITFVFSFKPIKQFIKNKIFAKHSEKQT